MSAQEILTFQLGTYSNFVGTHYWNIQKNRLSACENNGEYPSSKLFRESVAHNGYVPRLISFDLKSNLRTLKEDGGFDDDGNEEPNCGSHAVYSQPLFEKNEFMTQVFANDKPKKVYNLDDKVSTWSDFMTNRLHENSLQLLTQGYDDGKEFTYFGLGQEEYTQLRYDVDDKIHFWAEECNSLEGFQVFTDMHNGFSGITSKLLEDVQDEYNKKCALAYINWPIQSETNHQNIYNDINVGLTIQSLREHCAMFVLQSLQKDIFAKNCDNVCIPNFDYKPDLPYHSSAILATAIDSTSLPWREENRTMSLRDICYHITQSKWKLAGSSIGVEYFSANPSATLFERLCMVKELYGSLLSSLFPSINMPIHHLTSHSVVLQNISEHCVIPDKIKPAVLQGMGLNQNIFNNNPMSVVEFFGDRIYPGERTISKCFYINKEIDTNAPFPSIIKPSDETQITAFSTLFTCNSFYNLLHEIITRLRKINLHKHHIVQEFGLDNDIMNELLEDMMHFAQEYDHQRAIQELCDD